MLYSGESFDSRIGQQYLRARWYQTQVGRFARLDPFAGIADNPLAFNKYLYAHSQPVSGVDPTGKFFALVGVFVASSISNQMRGADAKASSAIARYGSAFFIDLIVLDSFRALSRIVNLAAKPVRGLTRNEKSVLEFIHRSARPNENRTAITKTLRDIKLYSQNDFGFGDRAFSVWGAFATRAIEGRFQAGAVTLGNDIYFNSRYNAAREWIPDSNGDAVSLLAHETTHSLQASWYHSLLGDYTFAPHYLWDTRPSWIGGYGYHGSVAEIEGHAMQDAVDKMLARYPGVVAQIVTGTQSSTVATDLANWYHAEEARLRALYGR